MQFDDRLLSNLLKFYAAHNQAPETVRLQLILQIHAERLQPLLYFQGQDDYFVSARFTTETISKLYIGIPGWRRIL